MTHESIMTHILWTGFIGVIVVMVIATIWGFWPSWRRSWKRGKHVIRVTQTEKEVAPEYGSMSLAEELHIRPWSTGRFTEDGPATDWRTQTFDSLSPESLDSTSNEGVD